MPSQGYLADLRFLHKCALLSPKTRSLLFHCMKRLVDDDEVAFLKVQRALEFALIGLEKIVDKAKIQDKKHDNVKAKIQDVKVHPATRRVACRLAEDNVEGAGRLLRLLDEDGRLSASDWRSKRKLKAAPRKDRKKEDEVKRRWVEKHKIRNSMLHVIRQESIQKVPLAGTVFLHQRFGAE